AEKLVCQCRAAPAMAMCQCQGPHQADFVNGCLRGVVPEGMTAPQFTLDSDATHYTLSVAGRPPFTLPVCACASPQPSTATGVCGRSPLALMAYDYPCLYPEQASALRAETVAEGYRVTARIPAENCTRLGGVPREPAEGELVPLGEDQPCTFLRPACPCSAPPSGGAPSGEAPSEGVPSGEAPSGSTPDAGGAADSPLKESAPPSSSEPVPMTDTGKEGGCSLII
ncbi:MAG TPA: hypothetical protein VFX30_07635, partial [bacterium]|nr:hypothetical protein [bacterium]